MSEPGDKVVIVKRSKGDDVQENEIEIEKIKTDLVWIKRLVLGLYTLAIPDAIQFFSNEGHKLGMILGLIWHHLIG